MDLSTLEADDIKESEVCCTQHPRYEAELKANRKKALQALVAYVSCRELSEASNLLYHVGSLDNFLYLQTLLDRLSITSLACKSGWKATFITYTSYESAIPLSLNGQIGFSLQDKFEGLICLWPRTGLIVSGVQVEAFLKKPARKTKDARNGQAVVALLGVLADIILGAGTPSICSPYLTSLFQDAVSMQLTAQPSNRLLPVCPPTLSKPSPSVSEL